MKKGVWILGVVAVAAASAITAGAAQAQHLHRHGNHFDVHQNVPHGHDAAGHLVDGYGHHIDGDGRHTGAVGVYENGSVSVPYSSRWGGYYPSYSSYPYYSSFYSAPLGYGSLYSGSLYSGSLYSGSLYSGASYLNRLYSSPLYSSPLYSAPAYSAPNALALPGGPAVNAAPNAVLGGAANTARNRIPVPQQAPAARGGSFVLINPRDSGGPIRYSLNSYAYTINPGETQSVPLDRDWSITFDNGLNQTVTYRMEDGQYEFTVSPQSGWDLVKRTPQVPANAMPGPPGQTGRRAL